MQGCGGGAAGTEDSGIATALGLKNAPSKTDAATNSANTSAIDKRSTRQPVTTTTLTIRAHAQLAANVGPMVEVRIDGLAIGQFEVRATAAQDYTVTSTGLRAGAQVELVYRNDEIVSGQDRNLFVAYISDGNEFVSPSQPGVLFDRGDGPAAFDGLNVVPGTEVLREGGALRLTWPASGAMAAADNLMAASRFLQQASFGPTRSEAERVATLGYTGWINEQQTLPVVPSYLPYIQSKYNLSSNFLPPNSANYTPDWLTQKFWSNAVTAPDQLRKRTAHALHSIFVTSLVDSNLFHHARAHAQYLDTLDRLAFGNFRDVIEEVALSPVMGLYLSHIRNSKEDPATHRLPDENFARELMQLFTIGLHELNIDGTPRLNSQGLPIETYNNADVMAMAKVFTGWSWGYDDNALTEFNFLWNWPWPVATVQGVARVDIRRMKPYPGLHSTAEKRLFTGKPNAVTIPSHTNAIESVRIALDTLFRHPNVGPFFSRQLIQRLVTSNPSAAYVQRVATVFNDNGKGVRGDLGAVVRAVLLDSEALNQNASATGKLREPVLRLAHALRAFNARSGSGEFLMATEPPGLGQRAHHMPSVFGYFRPGYVPPQSLLPGFAGTAPEFQTVDEATTANWINAIELMLREGIGWHGTARDITLAMDSEATIVASSPEHLLRHLELLLFTGRMPAELRKDIMDAMQGVGEASPSRRDTARARVALLVALTSPEYLIQR
jgi:uncharacterized protein (DUF1800 family)